MTSLREVRTEGVVQLCSLCIGSAAQTAQLSEGVRPRARRAERGIGVAIRRGQESGAIRKLGDPVSVPREPYTRVHYGRTEVIHPAPAEPQGDNATPKLSPSQCRCPSRRGPVPSRGRSRKPASTTVLATPKSSAQICADPWGLHPATQRAYGNGSRPTSSSRSERDLPARVFLDLWGVDRHLRRYGRGTSRRRGRHSRCWPGRCARAASTLDRERCRLDLSEAPPRRSGRRMTGPGCAQAVPRASESPVITAVDLWNDAPAMAESWPGPPSVVDRPLTVTGVTGRGAASTAASRTADGLVPLAVPAGQLAYRASRAADTQSAQARNRVAGDRS